MWLQGWKCLTCYECAGTHAVSCHDGLVIFILLTLTGLLLQHDSESLPLTFQIFCHDLTPTTKFSLNNWRRSTRKTQVSITSLYWQVPPLKFCLHMSSLAQSALCLYCNKTELLYILLTSQRFTILRVLQEPLQKEVLSSSLPVILFFDASVQGFKQRGICDVSCTFLC